MFARGVIGVTAAAVLAYAAALVFGGKYFPAPGQTGAAREHILLFVGITVAVSMLHVAACLASRRMPPRLATVLLVGVGVRLILLFGSPAPILEGDHARVRFEGRMLNRGLNPYEFKPVQLMDQEVDDSLFSGEQLARLRAARATMSATDTAPRPSELQRPDLRTDSTALSLWISSLADRFKPSNTRGYAFLILCADVLAGFLLLLALRSLHLPLGWLLIYAWCPVLLKEAYCTMAIDAFMMPAVAGLVYCLASGRTFLTAIPMALCAALRPATLFLLPVLGRRIGLFGVVLALVLVAVPYLPFHNSEVPVPNYVEGQAYAWRNLEYNSALENGFRGTLRYVPVQAENSLTIAGVSIVRPDERLFDLLSKVACLVVLLGVVTYATIRFGPDRLIEGGDRVGALGDLFLVLATLLLVSPVLQPQHAIWLLPILVVRPRGAAWLALPGLVSLCYLTHLVDPQAADLTFLGGQVSFRAFEYGTFVLLLLIGALQRTSSEVEEDEVGHTYRGVVGTEEDFAVEDPVFTDEPDPLSVTTFDT
ncbi:MAG: hypothetical protein ACYTGV_02690 [Planctomycetota bacterium]